MRGPEGIDPLRIWVTRTLPQAHETAQSLRAMGHEPIVAPVLETRALPARLDLDGVAALAFTSRNAVAAFADLSGRRDLSVFTTGEATAAAARSLGFIDVISADGDVHDLARLIVERRPGPVLHPGAAEPAGDLAGQLAKAGLAARSIAVYETVEAATPVPAADAVLVHSPKAATIVARTAPPTLAAYAISAAAAAPLITSNFQRVAVAPYPNEQALLKLLPAD
jgi:uroporphyrinogen-III synthase